jgi:hypothetical protein
MTYTKGNRVRFTMNNLGTTTAPYGSRMTEHVVRAGDIGTYVEPFRDDLGEKGWHITAVNLGLASPPILYCPVHESMIEPAEADSQPEELDGTDSDGIRWVG